MTEQERKEALARIVASNDRFARGEPAIHFLIKDTMFQPIIENTDDRSYMDKTPEPSNLGLAWDDKGGHGTGLRAADSGENGIGEGEAET